jgi:DNA-binding response OmpR family regulator
MIAAGADAYLTKPLDLTAFLVTLDRTLARTAFPGTLDSTLARTETRP